MSEQNPPIKRRTLLADYEGWQLYEREGGRFTLVLSFTPHLYPVEIEIGKEQAFQILENVKK